MGVETWKTYIIRTERGEFYCGKSINIEERMKQHLNEKEPSWLGFAARKKFKTVALFNGDYEKKIKKFGARNLIECLNSRSPPP